MATRNDGDEQMTYAEFQAYMARYGFPQCPLSEAQFKRAQAELGDDALFGVACDVNAGVAFATALRVNK